MKTFIIATLVTLAFVGVSGAGSHSDPVSISHPNLTKTPEGLSESDWSGIREAYEERLHTITSKSDGNWQARNPGQAWRTKFDARGFTVTPDSGDWSWGLELAVAHTSSRGSSSGNRVSFQRNANIEEWFINDRRGLEQGWTIQRPIDPGSELQTLSFGIRGGLKPRVSEDRRTISFLDDGGLTVLNYGGLKAWDAEDKCLDVRFVPAADETGFSISVDDAQATYPINIDPVAQQAYLKAYYPGFEDAFGCSVAVSGDTVVVGAFGEDGNAVGVNGTNTSYNLPFAGAAYIFVRTDTGWKTQAYLKASNTGANDSFGKAVAISGNVVVIGAPFEASSSGNQNDNSAYQAGAAYVFYRSGTTWSQKGYLKAFNVDAGDLFGSSVAASGTTVAVGAPNEASAVAGNGYDNSAPNAGAAYVFVWNGVEFVPEVYLKASNAETADLFGQSVGISGISVVVGASGEDSASRGVNKDEGNNTLTSMSGAAYVFVYSPSGWYQQAYLKASNTGFEDLFGFSVSISGDSVVVGAPQEDSSAIGVDGTQSDNSATYAGAAYVFKRVGLLWRQEAYLKASNTGATDFFGFSVSASGNKILVGAPQESSSATGVDGDQTNNNMPFAGAAYAFEKNEDLWSQLAYLKASNTGASDAFGYSVSISGDMMVSGAYLEDSVAYGVNGNEDNNLLPNSGAAYTFLDFIAPVPPIIITDCYLTGGVFTIEFTGEAGVTDWRVKGSADLVSFPDDLTALTIFVEVSPGVYTALVNVGDKPDRYFMRIEH